MPRLLVVSPAPDHDFPIGALGAKGYNVRVVPGAHLSKRLRRRRAARGLTLARVPDLVHLPSLALARELKAVTPSTEARLVVTVNTEDVLDASARDGALAADAYCVESNELAKLLQDAGAPPDAVAIVPPVPDGTLLGAPRRSPVSDGPLRILSVGPLSWTQGYEHALFAVKLLRDSGRRCEYRIAGRGFYRDPIGFARHQLGLDDCVELIEPRSRSEVRDLFGWAEVLLDSSVAPTSVKAVLDANAAAVPAVSSNPGLNPETALGARRRDPDSLCAALLEVSADTKLAQTLVVRGRALARSALTQTPPAALLDQLYRRAL